MSADQPKTASVPRLAVFYAILAAIVAVVFVLVINMGTKTKAQPTIAGAMSPPRSTHASARWRHRFPVRRCRSPLRRSR